jgi:hypothetical protein
VYYKYFNCAEETIKLDVYIRPRRSKTPNSQPISTKNCFKQINIIIITNVASIAAPQTPIHESNNLPAQKILQTDQVYPATIMSIDEVSFWVITDDFDEVCRYIKQDRVVVLTFTSPLSSIKLIFLFSHRHYILINRQHN